MLAISSLLRNKKNLRNSLVVFSVLTGVFQLCAQTTIWLENFSGANQGWTANFTDWDGTPGSFNGFRKIRY